MNQTEDLHTLRILSFCFWDLPWRPSPEWVLHLLFVYYTHSHFFLIHQWLIILFKNFWTVLIASTLQASFSLQLLGLLGSFCLYILWDTSNPTWQWETTIYGRFCHSNLPLELIIRDFLWFSHDSSIQLSCFTIFHLGHGDVPPFFQNRGSPECAFCTPLCTFSVLTYALTDRKTSKWQDSTLCILPLGHAKLQTNDKTQLSASLPWGIQNCKQMTRLNSLHPSLGACKIANKNPKNNKKEQEKRKTTLCLRHSGPVGLLGFLVFFFLFFFVFFLVFSFGSQSASVNILLFCPYSPCPFPSSHTMKGQPMPTQPHLWISSKCACFFDFLMVWAPSQKVT